MTAPKKLVQGVARTMRLGGVLPLTMTVRLYGNTDKYARGYTVPYARHLAPLRYRKNHLIEIGVGGFSSDEMYRGPAPGGSLRVWRDFLPRSRVVGFDLEAKSVALGSRVTFVRGDQGNEGDLARAVSGLGAAPNIVIDDGSHLVDHARASFNYLFPLMPAGGLYVVEDLHTSFWEDWGGALPPTPATAVGLAQQLVVDVQAQDPTFEQRPERPKPKPLIEAVAQLHVYPSIFFVVKR